MKPAVLNIFQHFVHVEGLGLVAIYGLGREEEFFTSRCRGTVWCLVGPPWRGIHGSYGLSTSPMLVQIECLRIVKALSLSYHQYRHVWWLHGMSFSVHGTNGFCFSLQSSAKPDRLGSVSENTTICSGDCRCLLVPKRTETRSWVATEKIAAQ